MKTVAIILSAALLAALHLAAQTTNAPAPTSEPALQAPPTDQPEMRRLPPLGPPRTAPPGAVTYGGVLVAAARADKPLHLLNPFAPPEYGDGTQHLRLDPYTGAGRGVSLFSIHFDFKPKAAHRKPAPDKLKPKPKKPKPAAKQPTNQ